MIKKKYYDKLHPLYVLQEMNGKSPPEEVGIDKAFYEAFYNSRDRNESPAMENIKPWRPPVPAPKKTSDMAKFALVWCGFMLLMALV